MELLNTLGFPLLSLVKVAIILFLFLYLIFSVVLVRQVKLMVETLEVGHEKLIASASYAHLIITLITLAASFVLL